MRLRRPTHLRLVVEATPVTGEQTNEQHAQQKAWVQMRQCLSDRRQERQDEARTQARIYSFDAATRRVENRVPYTPDPTRPAA